MNDDNLIPLNQRTQRERKEIASMGAHATNKAKRMKKTMRQLAEKIGEQLCKDKNGNIVVDEYGEELTNLALVVKQQFRKAQGKQADTQAARFIANLLGDLDDQPAQDTKVINVIADNKQAEILSKLSDGVEV